MCVFLGVGVNARSCQIKCSSFDYYYYYYYYFV